MNRHWQIDLGRVSTWCGVTFTRPGLGLTLFLDDENGPSVALTVGPLYVGVGTIA